MTVDHIGLFLFPEAYWMRMVGRLSFFLFAFLIANGAMHTKNIHMYLLRLFAFALISQIPYELIHREIDPAFSGLNIFFTLSAGLLAIMALKTKLLPPVKIVLAVTLAVIAETFEFSYGAYGVLMVVLFFVFFKNYIFSAVGQTLNTIWFNTIPFMNDGGLASPYLLYQIRFIQPIGLLSLPLIFLYNGQKGPSLKYLFYAFYPVHLLILYFILNGFTLV